MEKSEPHKRLRPGQVLQVAEWEIIPEVRQEQSVSRGNEWDRDLTLPEGPSTPGVPHAAGNH